MSDTWPARKTWYQWIELTWRQDKEYLSPIIRQVERELKEREELDNLVVKKR